MMKKVLNFALLISLIITIMMPLTGLTIHKISSLVFTLLCIVHMLVYSRKLTVKRCLMLLLALVAFATGILGLKFYEYPILLKIHKVVAISMVFFFAIHIFVFRKRLLYINEK